MPCPVMQVLHLVRRRKGLPWELKRRHQGRIVGVKVPFRRVRVGVTVWMPVRFRVGVRFRVKVRFEVKAMIRVKLRFRVVYSHAYSSLSLTPTLRPDPTQPNRASAAHASSR